MKIVSFGNEYRIFPDDLKTYDQFPASTYKINFNPMAGFSLEKIPNFENIEEKTYGNHEERIEKVLHSYERFNRSLGVILSGDKGMGKSLFTQMLAKEAVERGMPVIMVTKPFKGIAEFIDKIEQECLVIFDEFEKVFTNSGDRRGYADNQPDNSIESQTDLLGVFDGTSQQKRLYAITVNKLHLVNEYMVSRTGRFHYHIRFDYPTADEIEIYLHDKLEEQYHGEIKHVVTFATRVKLNYDSLRAIAFELNSGYSFKSAISDLNILNTDAQRYDVRINFTTGQAVDLKGQRLNLFGESIRLDGHHEGDGYFNLNFETSAIKNQSSQMVIDGNNVNAFIYDDEGNLREDTHVVSITISQHKEVGVNYHLV